MSFLQKVLITKREEVASRQADTPVAILKSRIQPRGARTILRALCQKGAVLIAEIKPRSPSKGQLISGDPLAVADLYAQSSADAISVLTDETYFGGSTELLMQVRARVPQLILRKDFIIDPYQVYEAAAMGADVFLLIVAALDEQKLAKLIMLGQSLGLEALVEVHTEDEIVIALNAGAEIIGINNRNLTTLTTDLAVTESLITKVPTSIPVISESGILTTDDARRVHAAGARGILVGTSVLESDDPVAHITHLKEALT
jgi:indole-3-glycerol phosphate synthase